MTNYEYVEPDSWDKLLKDLRSENFCNYFGTAEFSCKSCRIVGELYSDDCFVLMLADVSKRIRALLEDDAE